MNLLLTDHLICPRCPAESGLILLAERVQGRRVQEGRLGCPACRAQYVVSDGVADFADREGAREDEAADALKLAALLGITEGPAMLLLLGGYEEVAPVLAGMVQNVEVVVANASPKRGAEASAVSVLRIADQLPLRAGSMRGVVVAGSALHLVAEAARVCALAARIIVSRARAEERVLLQELGMHIALAQDDTLLAVRQS